MGFRAVNIFLASLLSLATSDLTHSATPKTTILADVNDVASFPSVTIVPPAQARPLKEDAGERFKLPKTLSFEGQAMPFNTMLERSGTLGWAVLSRGEIVDERYFGGTTEESQLTSFSVAKSVVGILAAVAQARGELPERNQPLPLNVLPGAYRKRPPRWQDLLDMKAGLAFNEDYASKQSDVGLLYMSTDLAQSVAQLRTRGTPGRHFDYNSASTQVLADALEHTVGQSLAKQLGERLWAPMGAEQAASWSTDLGEPAQIKAFCCLSATLRDYLRIGQLLVEAAAGKESVVPKAWVLEQLAAARRGETYRDQWWLLHDATAGDSAVALFAEGILGQYIFVHPAEQLVIVRMGKQSGDFPWRVLFGALVAENTMAKRP